MVILSPTQGSHAHHSYIMSSLVSDCTGIIWYYSLAPEAIFQIPCLSRRNQSRGEYQFSFSAAMISKKMSCQSHVEAMFQSQLLSCFHPLSIVLQQNWKVLGGRISLPMCLCNKEKWAPIPAEISGCCFRPRNAFGSWPKTDSSIHRAIIAQLCLVLFHT